VVRLMRTVNVDEVRKKAKRRLPREVFEVIEGGAGDEATLQANRADLNAIRLIPRSLEDVSRVELTTKILGTDMGAPFMIAPCSFSRMANPEAERAVARAAGAAGIGYIMPGGASETVERVAEVATGPHWYQIYMSPDDGVNEDLVRRVKESGFQALTVSVDTPMSPYRERDIRNGIRLPLTITPKLLLAGATHPKWAMDFVFGNMASGFSLTAAKAAYDHFESAMSRLRPVTLKDIEWLRSHWDGPLVVKGILHDDKIDELVDLGVNAVVVSNHGGRNLDGVTSSISALPRVADTAAGRLEVFVDSGFRRGIDVIRALALGADACLIGRPWLYGLAAGGERGVSHVLSLLSHEVRVALAFVGCTSPANVDRSVVQTVEEALDEIEVVA
jgi:isopentenyl diphosphate isomerase/L-lactate dehydrogenase-like FMN-dependent dehydrogenase